MIDNLFTLYKIKKNNNKHNLHLNLLLKDKNILNRDTPDISTVNNLSITHLYNKQPLIQLASPITVEKGDFVLLNGPSGQGKTTFFKFLIYSRELIHLVR
jgi:ABC-type bacteriocin/lantibiotic exporter with double-glycine peptidase domain